MRKICVTGGAGFIGSHLVDHMAKMHPEAEIVVIDKMGYAARKGYILCPNDNRRIHLNRVSITNRDAMRKLLHRADLVIHAAAESHVDNSYRDSRPFLLNNINGTVSLLQAAVDAEVGLLVHVSTDEVYGDNLDRDATKESLLNPTNPYSASKASAEMFVNCYAHSYGLRIRVTRANNIFGTRQYPEKLIPKLILDALLGRTFRVHGDGLAQRSFLHVEDYCRAVTTIVDHGRDNDVYNIPALREYSVNEVIDLVAEAVGKPRADFVTSGPDRLHNDSRYGMRGNTILALGWRPQRDLTEEIPAIVEWYRENLHLYTRRLPPMAAPQVEPVLQVASTSMRGAQRRLLTGLHVHNGARRSASHAVVRSISRRRTPLRMDM